MEIFKVLGLIFVSTVLCLIFKDKRSEYSIFIILFCLVLVLSYIVKQIIAPITIIEQKIEGYGINNNYFKVALKALGIGYITSFIADSCKDSGQTALANTAELVGKCSIFILSFPLVLSILETAIGLMK